MFTFVLLLALATLTVVGMIIMVVPVVGWSVFMAPWLDAMVGVAIIALIVNIFKFFTRKRT